MSSERNIPSKELALQVNLLMARVGGSLIDKRKGTVLLSRAEWELLRKYMDELHANWMAEIRKNSTTDETRVVYAKCPCGSYDVGVQVPAEKASDGQS